MIIKKPRGLNACVPSDVKLQNHKILRLSGQDIGDNIPSMDSDSMGISVSVLKQISVTSWSQVTFSFVYIDLDFVIWTFV